MKDALPYLPLLNLLLAPFIWVLNDMRQDFKAMREEVARHGRKIAALETANEIQHPGRRAHVVGD